MTSRAAGPICWVASIALLGLSGFARGDEIDDYVKSEMGRLKIPGLIFGIVRNGQLVRREAVGLADIDSGRDAKLDDLFEIGSLTKQFTAMGALILTEAGRIGLDDSISKYLPDAPAKWSGIKVRQLLNQDSGLPEYAAVPGIGILSTFTRAKFMDAVGKLPLDFQPGEAWAYSNTNYALLGWIIEQTAGEPYTKFIEENVLHPLGMNHTSFAEPDVEPPGLVTGYLLRRRGPIPSIRGAASIKSDGAMISNLADMVKWDAALSDFRLLSKKSYQIMWTRCTLNSGRTRSYGMGWFLNVPGTGAYMGHGGNSSGFSAGISRFPKLKLSVILLTNAYPVGGEVMTKKIAELFEPALRMPPFKEITDPDLARTERVKLAIAALATNNPDENLLDPEMAAPMKTLRGKQAGPGLWGQVRKLDAIAFGGARAQEADTVLTYRLTSGGHSYIAVILWTAQNKLAQASLYPER